MTFFVSESNLNVTKIECIENNFLDIKGLVIWPLISTAVLITIVPFITNGAYWLNLKFKQWRAEKKNEIEKKQLLTVEQSIQLRKQLREQELEFEKVLNKKDDEISLLQNETKDQQEEILKLLALNDKENNTSATGGSSYGSGDYAEFRQRYPKVFKTLGNVLKEIKTTGLFPENIDSELIEFYLVNSIIQKSSFSMEKGQIYKHTPYGAGLYKDYFNENFGENYSLEA